MSLSADIVEEASQAQRQQTNVGMVDRRGATRSAMTPMASTIITSTARITIEDDIQMLQGNTGSVRYTDEGVFLDLNLRRCF